jgi:hypothetical protein
MRDERGPWYLLTGVLIGVVLGLLYAWVVQPVRYTNTTPSSLRTDYKDQYRALIAAAYMANGDLVRAKARLDLLGDPDPYRLLAEQAQRTLAEGKSFEEARSLGMLAAALKQTPSVAGAAQATPGLAGTAGTPTPGLTATIAVTLTMNGVTLPTAIPLNPVFTSTTMSLEMPTGTPLPTRTPTATPGAPYVLSTREQLCEQTLGQGLIQVVALDATSQPVPGVEVIVTWEGGEDHFFTGLKPEISVGYADFAMTPGITYTLRLVEGGQPITGLTASECEGSGGQRYWGNWRLEFIQP